MRRLEEVGAVVAGLFLLWPVAARAQGLDDDDKTFLNDVRPLILPEEKAAFEKLEDRADRLEFQKIFWARRDRDLATPENEFQRQYEKDRAVADRGYSVPGKVGSATDCGRLFVLFGKPDEIERDMSPTLVVRDDEIVSRLSGPSYSLSGAVRRAETWVYKDRPDRRIQNGRAAIAFEEECRGGGDLGHQLDRMAAAKIVHPNITYQTDEDGHLVTLADQLRGETPTRGVPKRPQR